MKMEQKPLNDVRLIDNLDFSDAFFYYDGQNVTELFNKHYHQGTLIEHLSLQFLLNVAEEEYKYDDVKGYYKVEFDKLIESLEEASANEFKQNPIEITKEQLMEMDEEQQFKAQIEFVNKASKGFQLLSKLLMLRITQLKDSTSFYILIEFMKGDNFIGKAALLLFEDLFDFLFIDAKFFIQQTLKYESSDLEFTFLHLAMGAAEAKIVQEYFFIENAAQVKLKKGQLLVHPEAFSAYNQKTKQTLKNMPTEAVFFMPNTNEKTWYKRMFSAWQKGLVNFYDLSSHWGSDLLNQLNEEEKAMYNKHIYRYLKIFIIRNYHVNSKNGYVNLMQQADYDSAVLTAIKNDEYVCFLKDSGEYEENELGSITFIEDGWVKVHYPPEKIEGFIHKSDLAER